MLRLCYYSGTSTNSLGLPSPLQQHAVKEEPIGCQNSLTLERLFLHEKWSKAFGKAEAC